MDRNRYQTSQVADTIGVSVSTIRRLAARYAAHLSEEATPRAGGRRQFTEDDIAILREANRLTLAGMEEEEIAQRLAQSVTLPAQAVTAPPEPPATLPQLPPLRIDATAITEPLHRLADVVRDSNASMDRHAAALEKLANALIVFGVLLLAIVLIAVAVGLGWIG